MTTIAVHSSGNPRLKSMCGKPSGLTTWVTAQLTRSTAIVSAGTKARMKTNRSPAAGAPTIAAKTRGIIINPSERLAIDPR